MPDVAVRITTTGAEQAVQSFNQVAQASQQFSQSTMQTVTQARIATQGFGFALLEVARLARLAGPEGQAFAKSLEGGFVAIMATRGAVAAYRGVLQSQLLITKLLTEANIVLAASWGLALLAAAAIVAIIVILVKNHREAVHAAEEHKTAIDGLTASGRLAMLRFSELNDRLRDSILLQHMTAGTTAGLTLTTKGLLGPSVALHQTFVDVNADLKQMAEREKEVAASAIEFQKIPNYFREIGGASKDIERPAAIIAAAMAAMAGIARSVSEVMGGAFKNLGDNLRAAGDAYIYFTPKVTNTAKAAAEMGASFKNAIAGILTVTTQGADLFSQLWVAAINTVIQKMLEAEAVSTFFTNIATGILGFFGLQHGGSFIATHPMLVPVGEMNQAERITVSPLAGAPATGGGGMTVNFNAPQFWDQVTYANFIKKVGRDLTSGPVSRVG